MFTEHKPVVTSLTVDLNDLDQLTTRPTDNSTSGHLDLRTSRPNLPDYLVCPCLIFVTVNLLSAFISLIYVLV